MVKASLLYFEVKSTISSYKQDLNKYLMQHVIMLIIIIRNINKIVFFKISILNLVCLQSSKGQVNATRITAVAAGQYDSDIIEVRARIHPSQTFDFKCDILVNGKMYYFNYTEEKIQIFKSILLQNE
jgi:hypothetical protein